MTRHTDPDARTATAVVLCWVILVVAAFAYGGWAL